MYIEPHPFPYLKPGQYADLGNGEICFLHESVPEEKREWLRIEYGKWWKEREEERLRTGWI